MLERLLRPAMLFVVLGLLAGFGGPALARKKLPGKENLFRIAGVVITAAAAVWLLAGA